MMSPAQAYSLGLVAVLYRISSPCRRPWPTQVCSDDPMPCVCVCVCVCDVTAPVPCLVFPDNRLFCSVILHTDLGSICYGVRFLMGSGPPTFVGCLLGAWSILQGGMDGWMDGWTTMAGLSFGLRHTSQSRQTSGLRPAVPEERGCWKE